MDITHNKAPETEPAPPGNGPASAPVAPRPAGPETRRSRWLWTGLMAGALLLLCAKRAE